MVNNKTILELVDKYTDKAVEIRRHIHENPELSSQEHKTGDYLKGILSELGYVIENVPADERSAGTGFTATLDTGRPGKTIGLRADLDALPVQEPEMNSKQKRLTRSKVDAVMHACGHDLHMAVSTTTALILHELKDQLSGKIVMIYEEAEETNAGIEAMVNHLKDRGIDVIYGNHVDSSIEAGKMTCDGGPVTAGSAIIGFDVIGRGGHGSRPDQSINPLFAAAAIVNSISIAWSQQIDVTETVTLGLTQLNVGEANNVIADRAHIGGTLRFYNKEEGEKAYNMLMEIAESVAKAHNCTIEVDPYTGPMADPTVNDEEYAKIVRDGIEDLYDDVLVENHTIFASESFAQYKRVAPIAFSFIGVRNEEFGSTAGPHNEYFDVDEAAIPYAVGTMVKFAVGQLSK